MSTQAATEARKKASKELTLAGEMLLQVAAAYRKAWSLQRAAMDYLEQAGESLEAWGSETKVPEAVSERLRSLAAVVKSAELIQLDVEGEEQQVLLETEARAVEDVAGAAQHLASALDNVGRLFPEGGAA